MSLVVLITSYPKNNKELKLETSTDRKKQEKCERKREHTYPLQKSALFDCKKLWDKINQSQVIT